jgi:hypothetical protein
MSSEDVSNVLSEQDPAKKTSTRSTFKNHQRRIS